MLGERKTQNQHVTSGQLETRPVQIWTGMGLGQTCQKSFARSNSKGTSYL